MTYRLPCLLLAGLAITGSAACASQPPLAPQTASSASSTGYALGYAESVKGAADSFAAHRQQAHALSSGLAGRAPQPKPGEDRAQLLYVLDQADADGRRAASVEARRSERAVRAFWESERGAIGARAASAAQKQVADAGCTQPVDAQPAVQQALREGVSRQLERRLRRESEAQRYLDEIKGRISPATWSVTQRSAEDVADASYLVYVALVEDVLELQRLASEQATVVETLQSGLERERAIQGARYAAKDVEASKERSRLYEAKLSAAQSAKTSLDQALADHKAQLDQARGEYEQALAALKAKLAPPPSAAPAPARAK